VNPVSILKATWKHLPTGLQQETVNLLCRLQADKRDGTAQASGPLYVLGSHRAATGLGVSARSYSAAREKDGYEVVRVDITREMFQNPEFSLEEVRAITLAQARHATGPGTVSLHANPPLFHLALVAAGRRFLREKRLIAYWAWELEKLSPLYRHGLDYADAFEVPSTFVQQAVVKDTAKEVTVVPHRVAPPARCKSCYAEDGILRCLFIFDMASSYERKNPLAAIEAFTKAFPDGGAELTLKVSQAGADPLRHREIMQAASRPGIRVVTEMLSDIDLEKLYLAHDVYLSLHRSEGYGLTIREAMLCGLHVVAVGWSGNMDFMHGERVHPVPYALVPVRARGSMRGMEPRWAEADTDAAAQILRDLRHTLVASGCQATERSV